MTQEFRGALTHPKTLAAAAITAFVLLAAGLGYLLFAPDASFNFAMNQKVSASSPLRLAFPALMDHGSVEERISVPKDLNAAMAWDGETLVLTPATKLELGRVVTVRLDGRTLKADGEQLGRDLQFTFTVAGAPAVSARLPAPDSTDVPVSAEIVIVFDRPVVPLSQLQGDGAKAKVSLPVSVSPDVRGKWRWLGTTTLAFEPEQELRLATKYTVKVPSGIPVIGGERTEADFTWTFETVRPQVTGALPSDGSRSAGPTSVLSFTLNHDADLISAKDSIVLHEIAGSRSIPVAIKTVKYGTKEDETGKNLTDKKTVVAVPAEPLGFSSTYVGTVKAGIRGLQGDLGSASGFTAKFHTVGPLSVKSARYADGHLAIDFTSPVSGRQLSKFITFEPPVGFSDDVIIETYQTMSDGAEIHRFDLYANFEPSTRYKLTVSQELQDIYEQELKSGFTYAFETAALPSAVFLHPQWKSFSVFEKGKPPVFHVNDINVSTVQVEFGKVPLEKFLSIRQTARSNQNGVLIPMEMRTITDDYSATYVKPGAKKNEWESQPLDLEKAFGKLEPGIYAISVTAPEWVDPYTRLPGRDQRFFAVTNLGLTLKYSGSKALVWVTDLQTGNPVSGASIKFRNLTGAMPVSGTTDKDGFFEAGLPLSAFKNAEYDWMPEFWVTAEKSGDFAFIGSDWNNGIQPYDFGGGIYTDFRGPEAPKYRLQSTLYTERPLYGAGDTVFFKGILRLVDENGKMTVPDTSRSAHVTVTDMNGTEIYAKDLKLNAFGSFSDSFPLAKEAPLGYYSLSASIIPDADIEGSAYASFRVLAYRKPEYRAEISTDKAEYFGGDTVKGTVSGMYYFGAPMADSTVVWRLTTSNYFFNKYTEEWYSFALEDAWCWSDCSPGNELVTEGRGTLDAAGRLAVSAPVTITAKPVSQVMTLEADLTDKNNQVVSTRTSFIAHKSRVYVGIRSDDYAVAAGTEAPISLITLDTEGKPVPNRAVAVSLYSRTWNTVREKGVDGEFYYSSEPEDVFIRSYNIRTGDNGKASVDVTLPEGGEYRVVAVAKDDAGLESKAGWTLYAWADAYFNWPRTNNDRMEIVSDKPEYKVGETAKLIVKSPYQGKGVKALVTIEREQVMEKRIVDVTGNAMSIEVPIKDDHVPAVYVSVMVLKPRIGETFNENGLDTGAPAMKMGMIRLPVNTETKTMTVSIVTDKEKYVPGEKVKVTITAKDMKGNPTIADVSLGVVDLSLLDLAGFQLPDLVSQFYYERGTGVQTASMLLFLMERFKPGSKGGGGDGEERTRGNFKDTAYWNPHLITDRNGVATAEFTLPDNLTTWQLLAMGSTKESLFGSFAKNIIETKRVIVRPVRPRFGVVGDKVTLGAIVHNELEEDRTFTVSLAARGLTLTGKKEQTVKVAKGGNVKVLFPATVQNTGSAVMHFTATTEGAKDDIVETIPVYPFGVLQSDATAGVTEDQVTESVVVPAKADAPTGSLTIGVSPSLAVYLPKALGFLSTFPYGCAEQIASSFLPNLALKRLSGFEQFKAVSDRKLEEHISAGLQKLYTFQRADGGFGYFEGSDRSYPYLTAYVLYALKTAKDTGYAVDASVVNNAVLYLQTSAAGRDPQYPLDPASRAYVLFVLSQHGKHDTAALAALLKDPQSLPIFSRAYIAMSYEAAGNHAKAVSVLTDVMNLARVDADSAHFEEGTTRYYESMNSDAVTTAIVLQAANRIQPDHPMVPRIIQGMLSSRHDGHWDTTQATSQSILALTEYLQKSRELEYAYQTAVEVGGVKVMNAEFRKPVLERRTVEKALDELKRGTASDIKIGKAGPGKLYYDIDLTYFFTPETIEPLEQGIGILRESKPLTKADASMKAGTMHKVTLTITVPETRHFVAVESMLAAGEEPIDLQYATSQRTMLENAANATTGWDDWYRNQTWRFSHIEYRDDRIFLFAEELPAGVYKYEYLVRNTTPGTFRQRPAKVWEMYSPENFGQTSGGWLRIGE